jgi:hypothetical protein
VLTLSRMTEPRGRKALLTTFDRLFERAASKLHLAYTAEEQDEAKQRFVERYDEVLRVIEQGEPPIGEAAVARMEAAIDELSPAAVAGHLATGPLVLHLQEAMHQIAVQAAEQRLLERLVGQADDRYGGN